MAFRMSIDLQNAMSNLVVTGLAGSTGTGGTGNLKIYSGTQCSSATCGTPGTLTAWGVFLVEINNIAWSASTNGTAAFASTAGYSGTAVTSGTAVWGRLECVNASGTCRVDGDVGTASNNVFTINVASILVDEVVTITAADIYMA